MDNTVEGINSRITETEQIMTWKAECWKSLLRNRITKRMKRNEDSISDLWDNIKCTTICIIGVPEGEEREKGSEKIFEEKIAESSLP